MLTKLKFIYRFSKNFQILNFMGIHPAGAQLYHADGHPDRQTELIVALSNSVKAPKKELYFYRISTKIATSQTWLNLSF
jgi:hypothetical protein